MNLRKLSVGLGGVAVVALLVLVSPKAAHAVVAALVQVVNTSANPVVVQAVPTLASQIVTLGYNDVNGRDTFNVLNPPGGYLPAIYQILPSGQRASSPFVAPAGESFVLTGIDITGCTGSGNTYVTFGLVSNSSLGGAGFVVPLSEPTSHVPFSPGIVFPAGGGPYEFRIWPDASTGCVQDVFAHGYLTTN